MFLRLNTTNGTRARTCTNEATRALGQCQHAGDVITSQIHEPVYFVAYCKPVAFHKTVNGCCFSSVACAGCHQMAVFLEPGSLWQALRRYYQPPADAPANWLPVAMLAAAATQHC